MRFGARRFAAVCCGDTWGEGGAASWKAPRRRGALQDASRDPESGGQIDEWVRFGASRFVVVCCGDTWAEGGAASWKGPRRRGALQDASRIHRLGISAGVPFLSERHSCFVSGRKIPGGHDTLVP